MDTDGETGGNSNGRMEKKDGNEDKELDGSNKTEVSEHERWEGWFRTTGDRNRSEGGNFSVEEQKDLWDRDWSSTVRRCGRVEVADIR